MKKIISALIIALLPTFALADFKIIVPFTAGGAVDFVARDFALYVERNTGERVIVENATGAGSIVGTRKLLESTGDVALVSSSSFYVNIVHGTFDASDFRLASTVAEAPMLLAVPKSKELTCEKLRTLDRPFFIGNAGKDSITSVPTKFVTDKFKNYTEVAYKGVSQAMIDLIAGRLDLVFIGTKTDRPELDIIANTGPTTYNGAPSMKECLGINNYSIMQWVIVTNKNASDEFVKRLNELALAYSKHPGTIALYREREIKSNPLPLNRTEKQYSTDLAHWFKILK